MVKIKNMLETIYICVVLMFFSKELVNKNIDSRNKFFEECGILV